MHCTHCGSPIADNARFCPVCGAPAPAGAPDSRTTSKPVRLPVIAAAIIALLLILGAGGMTVYGIWSHRNAAAPAGSASISATDELAANGAVPTKDTTPAKPAASAKKLDIAVQQVDASSFPHVKIYLDIKDADSGTVPSGLGQQFFTLERQDANARYVKQKITTVNQLNEREALKVDLVADVSGSMEGQPIADARSIMNDFIDSMQFDAGDEAELTSFSTGVRLEQEFTKDAISLHRAVNGLSTDSQTSLYDALYTAVERVAAQSGARCVIAFTDGLDNHSSVTLAEVEEFATRYHVPVFIIGVGDSDYSSLSELASKTGGTYYNVSDITSMSSIYDEIYRAEKDLYLLEYDDASGAGVSEATNIRVGYAGSDYTGSCDYSYTPNVLNNVQGKGLYQNGPEATVEGYLKNWAPAISNKDYSKIRPYIKDGSNLHSMQESYVQNGFAEKLDSYEITGTGYSDNDHATVHTRETFYVQYPDKPLELLTQVVTYTVERVNGQWYMTDLTDLEVPIRINQ